MAEMIEKYRIHYGKTVKKTVKKSDGNYDSEEFSWNESMGFEYLPDASELAKARAELRQAVEHQIEISTKKHSNGTIAPKETPKLKTKETSKSETEGEYDECPQCGGRKKAQYAVCYSCLKHKDVE